MRRNIKLWRYADIEKIDVYPKLPTCTFIPEAVVSISLIRGYVFQSNNWETWLKENTTMQWVAQHSPNHTLLRRVIFEDMGDAIRFAWHFDNEYA